MDAGVAIKLVLVEALSDRADALFDHLTDAEPPRFYVPDLFFVECADILWKHVHFFRYSDGAARQDLADLISLPFRVVSTAELASDALTIAIAEGITTCAAVYVALAQRLSLPVVTADQTLARRLARVGVDVRFLGDWPPGSGGTG